MLKYLTKKTATKAENMPILGLFSSPEPKAHGELIVYQSIRRLSVWLCVCLSVNIFKLEYLRNQWANHNQILSEASLGRGKGCIRFWTRSDKNSGVLGN